MMGWSLRCYIPSFVEIGPPVLEKIFEGFLPYMGRGGHLGHGNPHAANKLSLPLPIKFGFDWPSGFREEDA